MAATMWTQFARIKPTDQIVEEGDHGGLKRSMGLLALTMFSVGSIVGTGIFVILGEAVPKAGPAVVLAFVLAAVTCGFSALSYAELAGSIPVSGSSYSYTYATLGELIAWIVGWCLMLEYGVSVAAVAVGWGQYLNDLLALINMQIPAQFANPPGEGGGIFNIPAVLVVVMCMVLLLRGVSESATVNTVLVFVKIGILALFCITAFTAFEPGNFAPFMPLGVAGVSAAAAQVFFSYIGFDAASTAGEEAKNPKRDLPRAIIISLIVVTLLYVVVAAAAIGVRGGSPAAWEGQDSEAVLAGITQQVSGSNVLPAIVGVGAVVAIFSVVLVVMYGQTRIMFAMGRDGLLPKVFTKVNPRTRTPVYNTLIVTAIISVLAAVVPLGQLAEATSIGTLTAFAIVNFGVLALWWARPDLSRSFRVPLLPLFPILGALFCIYLIFSLSPITWLVFVLWMLFGLAIYLLYGRRHSNAPTARPEPIAAAIAAPALRTRSMLPSAVIAVMLLVATGGIATVSIISDFKAGGLPLGWMVLFVMVVVSLGLSRQAVQLDKQARQLVDQDAAVAATGMRQAMRKLTFALALPSVLLVLLTVF